MPTCVKAPGSPGSTSMSWSRAFLVWLVLIGAETVHGILRTLFLQPVVGDFRARQIAVFTGAALILAVSYAFGPWLRATSTAQLLGVGFLWLALTLLFEVTLGRLLLPLSWDRIASDYELYPEADFFRLVSSFSRCRR
jgi:hypothetical protein